MIEGIGAVKEVPCFVLAAYLCYQLYRGRVSKFPAAAM